MFHRVRSFSRRHGRNSEGMLRRSVVGTSFYQSTFTCLYFFQFTRKNGRVRYGIVTLDPNKFAEKKQQCLHIGNRLSFTPFVSLKKSSHFINSGLYLFYAPSNIRVSHHPRYPPDTKAFLYYSMSSEKPRIAGELRLRVTSSNDTALFESGWDLLRPDGQIWSRSLFIFQSSTILCMKNRGKINLSRTTWIRFWPSSPQKKFLSPKSTFIVDFSFKRWVPCAITEQGGMQTIQFQHIFTDCRDNGKVEPYTGAYTSYRSLETPNQYILIILMNFRKCLGSIRTFNAPIPQRHKDRCVTHSQDNYSCEVCHSPLRWPHIFSKGRRALPETFGWIQSLSESLECQY